MNRFSKFKFISPQSKQPLAWIDEVQLKNSDAHFEVVNNKLYILKKEVESNFKTNDFTDKIKSKFKFFFGRYYQFAIYLLSPVMPRFRLFPFQTFTNYKIGEYAKGKDCIIQIGSGNDRIHPSILNIDIFDYPEVDIIADCANLPFADESIDMLISNAMLEHVDSPELFLTEARRVLKKDGIIISGVPFMQGFHASPDDYWRWTNKGIQTYHSKFGFEKKEVAITTGPASGFVWMLSEFVALLLSFNIPVLYLLITIFLNLILLPIKLLDIFLIHLKNAHYISSFFMYVGGKKS